MRIESWEREVAIHLVDILVSNGICSSLGERALEELFDEKLCKLGFGCGSGMTKACFWHEDLDEWVIKVGYTERVSKDYARAEYENYKAAVEANLAYYFPFTDFLCESNGIEFFIQERAECDEEVVTSDWCDKLAIHYEENDIDFNPDYIWDEVYDMEDYDKIDLMFNDYELCAFLSAHKIGDFHEGNFGFIGDRTVICDFSGYAG